jgi:hypothetical protein
MMATDDMTIKALCAFVSNIDTKNALKNPTNPTIIMREFNENEPATARIQKASKNPLQGSVVNARDNNIGVLSLHVVFETSHNATMLSTTSETQAYNHNLRNNIINKLCSNLYTILFLQR